MDNNWYSRLRPKERRLFIVFGVALFFSLYFHFFLKPTLNKLSTLKKQGQEAKGQAQLLLAQLPDLDKARLELDSLKSKLADIQLKSTDIEFKLLNPAQVPQLLNELIKCSQGLAIDFQSVKQKVEEDKDGFSRLSIEIKFESKYENAVNYINKIEQILSFAKVQDVGLAQAKSDPRNLVNVSLRLIALLNQATNAAFQISTPESPAQDVPLNIAKNPLTPRFGAGKTLEKKALRLSGITFRSQGPEGSTAIINEMVVKPGDEIEGYKVESILSDKVVINDGIEPMTLKIER